MFGISDKMEGGTCFSSRCLEIIGGDASRTVQYEKKKEKEDDENKTKIKWKKHSDNWTIGAILPSLKKSFINRSFVFVVACVISRLICHGNGMYVDSA